MKFKKIKVILLLTVVLASSLSLAGCGKSEQKDTEVWQSAHADIGKLLSCKDSYVGDNSKDSIIICNLPMNEFSKGFELKTDSEPYEMTINYGDAEDKDTKFADSVYASEPLDEVTKKNAMIIFSLVKNVSVINFNVNESSKYTYKRDEIISTYSEEYGTNLEKIIESESSLSNFIKDELK